MQSYAVNEWEERGILLEATFTPLAFGAQWLPGTGASTRSGCSPTTTSPRPASTSPTARRAAWGSPATARCGSPTGSPTRTPQRLVFGIARAAELFYAAGAAEVYPQIAGIPTIPKNRHRRPRGLASARRRAAPRGLPPDGHRAHGRRARDRGVVGTDGAVHGADGLYVADGSLLPSSIGVNPMMTIIAMASRVARQLADRLS